MNDSTPPCLKCHSIYAYQDQGRWSCPECGHEWAMKNAESENGAGDPVDGLEKAAVVRDANGELLQDGDTVILIKDLKIKGSSQTIKIGTKVKNIRLVEGDHDIDCKIAEFGAMKLKSQFVKKV